MKNYSEVTKAKKVMDAPEQLKTLIIDIENKKFEINGVPFGTAHDFSLSFENGTWYLSVAIPKKYKAEYWEKYDTHGNKISDNNVTTINHNE